MNSEHPGDLDLIPCSLSDMTTSVQTNEEDNFRMTSLEECQFDAEIAAADIVVEKDL